MMLSAQPLSAAIKSKKLLSTKSVLSAAMFCCLIAWSATTAFLLHRSVDADVNFGKQTLQRHRLPPINVAFGLSGNDPRFLSEFEVALKSVLLHAPLERDLQVHVLADEEAFRGLGDIFNRTNLATWTTRNQIQVHAYDVTPDLEWLKLTIVDTFAEAYDPKFELRDAIGMHTIGCFFRLMAHHFIPPTTGQLLYMDTDVVLMANLEGLWREVESRPDALFHWGAGMCSGFLVMNVTRIHEIWTLARGTQMKEVADKNKQLPNDQLIYKSINVTYPSEVHLLTEGWDMSVTNRWPKHYLPYDEKFPNVGMLHFNGYKSSKEAYFKEHQIKDDGFMKIYNDTWGNGRHYSSLPWPWARYQAKTVISPGSTGHLINISLWGQHDKRPWSTKVLGNSITTTNR